MSLNDFQIICKLGEGAYSNVYQVIRKQDQQFYALKKVKLLNLSQKERENAFQEVKILASIRNPYIIGYKEVFIEEKYDCSIIMEYADDGDLYQKIAEKQIQHSLFDEKNIWIYFIQIVKGLKALHDVNVLHRDIKSANIFLNQNNEAKLGDMNVSKKLQRGGILQTQTGTPYYASPEVWKDQPYDYKSDIWSLGCILYEMITLYPPFNADDMDGLFHQVIKGQYAKIPTNYSQDLAYVIKSLLQVKPSERPDCNKILQMPQVIKHMEKGQFIEVDEFNVMLKTIRLSKNNKNLHYLTSQLPRPNYNPLRIRQIDQRKFLSTLNQPYSNPYQNNNPQLDKQISTRISSTQLQKLPQDLNLKYLYNIDQDQIIKQQNKILKILDNSEHQQQLEQLRNQRTFKMLEHSRIQEKSKMLDDTTLDDSYIQKLPKINNKKRQSPLKRIIQGEYLYLKDTNKHLNDQDFISIYGKKVHKLYSSIGKDDRGNDMINKIMNPKQSQFNQQYNIGSKIHVRNSSAQLIEKYQVEIIKPVKPRRAETQLKSKESQIQLKGSKNYIINKGDTSLISILQSKSIL